MASYVCWVGTEQGRFGVSCGECPHSVHPAGFYLTYTTPMVNRWCYPSDPGQEPPEHPGAAVRNAAGGLGWTSLWP